MKWDLFTTSLQWLSIPQSRFCPLKNSGFLGENYCWGFWVNRIQLFLTLYQLAPLSMQQLFWVLKSSRCAFQKLKLQQYLHLFVHALSMIQAEKINVARHKHTSLQDEVIIIFLAALESQYEWPGIYVSVYPSSLCPVFHPQCCLFPSSGIKTRLSSPLLFSKTSQLQTEAVLGIIRLFLLVTHS